MASFIKNNYCYKDTGMSCCRCGYPVYRSDNPEYSYQCFNCDEDLYDFEAVETQEKNHQD